jgi:RND family efflux transporter MFP subunit
MAASSCEIAELARIHLTCRAWIRLHVANELYVILRLNMMICANAEKGCLSLPNLVTKRSLLAFALIMAYATPQTVSAAEKPPTKVVVEKVRKTEVVQTFPAIGRFIARQHGVVAALTNGPVKEMLVNVGDRVEAGQVVSLIVKARIQANRDLLAAELREKEAALRTAQAQLKLTLGEMERIGGLKKSAAFSQGRYSDKRNEVAKVRSEVSEAEGAVAKARANLKLASIDLYNAEVRAPYNGVVVRRHAVAGAYLAVGDPVVTLVNDRELEVEADVPAERLLGVSVGREVRLRLSDGTFLQAKVRAIVPSENAKTRTRPVRFSMNMSEGAERPAIADNQSVTVLLPVARARRTLTVHKDAVTSRGANKVVITVVDETATPRNIRVGDAVGERFTVLSGLEDGDIVVIRGNEGLRPGQKVTFEAPSD